MNQEFPCFEDTKMKMQAKIEFTPLMRMEPREASRLGKAVRDYAKGQGIVCKETIMTGGGVEYACDKQTEALAHFINGYLASMGFNLETWQRAHWNS